MEEMKTHKADDHTERMMNESKPPTPPPPTLMQ